MRIVDALPVSEMAILARPINDRNAHLRDRASGFGVGRCPDYSHGVGAHFEASASRLKWVLVMNG